MHAMSPFLPGTRRANGNILTETDFSTTPPNTIIWRGALPWVSGDIFPPAHVQERANIYKTNLELYRANYAEIFPSIIAFQDYLRKPVTNMPVTQIIPNLPDFREITETHVDMISAKPPMIDSKQDLKGFDEAVNGSNFATAWQSIIRDCIRYGNSVKRVDTRNGKTKVIDMPLKCWIPLMCEDDTTEVAVNLFFNIYTQKSGRHETNTKLVEFMLYHADGTIEKITHLYSDKTLGEQVESESAKPSDESPIIVFSGTSEDGVIGESQYKYWEPAIIASIRAFGTLLQLLERTKEFTKTMPKSATMRDENSGAVYDSMSDTIAYDEDTDPKNAAVSYASPDVELKIAAAREVYTESLKRLSRDTSLAFSMYDTKELGTNMSAKALKVSMYKSELRAESFITRVMHSLKELVYKIAKSAGLEDMKVSDFSIICNAGFIQDEETLAQIVSSRTGGATTLSVAQAIAKLDGVTTYEAEVKAQELAGVQPAESTLLNQPTTTSEAPTLPSFTTGDIGDSEREALAGEIQFSVLEGANINAD